MPSNGAEWMWFLFFSIGTFGGYITIICLLIDAWSQWRKR